MAPVLKPPPSRLRTRWRRRIAVLLPALALLSVVVAANLTAVTRDQRFDLTSAGVYTMSNETRRAIATLESPLTITFFYDLRSKVLLDSKALLDQYAAASPLIKVRAVDPTLQPALARKYNVAFAGTAIFESGGRRVVVNGGSETDFTNGLIRASAQAAQRICFTDGHGESDAFSLQSHDHFEAAMDHGHTHSVGGRRLDLHERHGMGMAREALETLGYEVVKVLLLGGPAALDGCTVVIAASPQNPFRPIEVQLLRRYVLDGGKLMLLLEPFLDAGLGPVMDAFGLEVGSHLILDHGQHYWTDPGTPAVTSYPRHKITRNLALTFFPGVAEVLPRDGGVPDDVVAAPLVETSDKAVLDGVSEDAPLPRARALMVYAIKSAAGVNDDRAAHLVVVGDGDFATNSYFHILGNGALFLNAVSVLAERDKLVDIVPRNYELPRVTLSNRQMQATFLVSTVLLPGLLLLAGAMVWWRNR
jgi:hypothetical protein